MEDNLCLDKYIKRIYGEECYYQTHYNTISSPNIVIMYFKKDNKNNVEHIKHMIVTEAKFNKIIRTELRMTKIQSLLCK